MVAAELFYLQVMRGGYYYRLSQNNRTRVIPLEGWRGEIKDRTGQVLAGNRRAYDVVVIPQDITQEGRVFDFLSRVSGRTKKALWRLYRRKKRTPFTPVVLLEDVPREQAIVIEENKYRFPGLFVQETFRRFYPLAKNSAHVLGYVGKISQAKKERFKEYGYSPQSLVGYLGVEEYYDSYLTGEPGGIQVEVNSRGRQVRLVSLKEPTRGMDITLTIDARVQKVAMDLLEGRKGAVVVMDIRTGEVLAMVSAPAYDPNVFVAAQAKKTAARVLRDQQAPLLNRAIKGLFPPGSVFKVPVALAGLDTKKIRPETSFVCEKTYRLGGMAFGCTHRHGPQNLIESLAHSCNIYYYHLGRILGPEVIRKYARMLGLGRLTHVDLPYEKAGWIPGPSGRFFRRQRRWYPGDTLNLSIGQGDVLATPLQLTRMMATVANDGLEVHPHLIRAMGGEPWKEYSLKHAIKIDPRALRTVQKGLRATVTDYAGTAYALDMRELYVAGKTGTAQSSAGKEDHSWFVGYAKGERRDVAFCVFLEHGGSSHNAVLLSRRLLLKLRKLEVL